MCAKKVAKAAEWGKQWEKVKRATGQLVAKKEPFFKVIKKHWMLLLMLAPAVCYVIVFSYIPMTGVILAFKQYQYKGGIYHSPWIGLAKLQVADDCWKAMAW